MHGASNCALVSDGVPGDTLLTAPVDLDRPLVRGHTRHEASCRVALTERIGRAPYCSRTDRTRGAPDDGSGACGSEVREVPRRMAAKTRGTGPAGARLAPPEDGTSRAASAQDAAAYRAASQRCWACNAPDSEPVRLQRRAGARWVSEATVQLCTACLTALRTPRLVRQLGLGRARTLPPARPAPTEAPPEESPVPGQGEPNEPPLTLLKGA